MFVCIVLLVSRLCILHSLLNLFRMFYPSQTFRHILIVPIIKEQRVIVEINLDILLWNMSRQLRLVHLYPALLDKSVIVLVGNKTCWHRKGKERLYTVIISCWQQSTESFRWDTAKGKTDKCTADVSSIYLCNSH